VLTGYFFIRAGSNGLKGWSGVRSDQALGQVSGLRDPVHGEQFRTVPSLHESTAASGVADQSEVPREGSNPADGESVRESVDGGQASRGGSSERAEGVDGGDGGRERHEGSDVGARERVVVLVLRGESGRI